MTTSDTRDTDRDAWLSQALRHAPDAGSDAPRGLSETILREARAAVARPASAAPKRNDDAALRRLASAWAWLARPPVAAGFASVMVATLVGLLWWDKPLEETLPREPVVASTPASAREEAPAAAASAPAVAGTQRAEREAAIARLGVVKDSAMQGPPAIPAVPAPTARAQAPAAAKKEAPAPMAAPARTQDAVEENDAARQRAEGVMALRVPAAPSAEPFPAPRAAAPAAVATAAAPAPAAQRRDADTMPAEAPARALAGTAADKSAAAGTNELRLAQGNVGTPLAKGRMAEVRSSPLAGLLESITQQPERWSWQRGNGGGQPMNAALQSWLVQVERITKSRWRGVGEAAPPETTRGLRLLRDGVPLATLGLASEAVRVEQLGTATASALPPVMAALPAASAEALAKALDEAAP